MKRVLLWVFATALAGCATSYNGGRMGFTGGVDAQMITNDTAQFPPVETATQIKREYQIL